MKARHIAPLVALAALIVPNWVLPPDKAFVGAPGYFGGILIALLVLIVQAIWRERHASGAALPGRLTTRPESADGARARRTQRNPADSPVDIDPRPPRGAG
jgi:hypothetical protein